MILVHALFRAPMSAHRSPCSNCARIAFDVLYGDKMIFFFFFFFFFGKTTFSCAFIRMAGIVRGSVGVSCINNR